jgi:hypothetical protein
MITTTFIYLALLRLATAKNTTSTNTTEPICRDGPGVYNSFNVTGTNVVPGFQPPGVPSSNWTLNFGVSETLNATIKTSKTKMYMWIGSTDNATNLDSPDLPYTGCVVSLLLDRQRKSTGGSIGADGQDGCEGVFTEKCYNWLLNAAKNSARQPLNGKDAQKRCLLMTMFEESTDCDYDDAWSARSAHGTSTFYLLKPPNHSLQSCHQV